MSILIDGVIHGNIIELKHSPGMADGEEVEIEVRRKKPARPWGEGIMRSAGIAADVSGFDEVFSQIERDRKL
jgi:hypothetical protein